MSMPIRNVVTMMVAMVLNTGCVPSPSPTTPGSSTIIPGGFFVLCEGLWRQNNSALTYVNPVGSVTRDVVSAVNNGMVLGDNASDVIVIGDTLVVVMNSAATLERFHRTTGKWIDRLKIPRGRQPYRITYDGVDKLYCTLLNDDSIIEIDAKTLAVTVERVLVGPAPEGIAVHGNEVYVAMSGYGDVRAIAEGSGTVAILRTDDLRPVRSIPNVPNVSIIRADHMRKILWIAYRNFPSIPDSVGGIVKYSAESHTVIARMKFKEVRGLTVDPANGDVYVLYSAGVDRVTTDGTIKPVIKHASSGSANVWYGLHFEPKTSMLYIANARQYVTDGEVIVVNLSGEIVNRFNVGLNPSTFAF